jgi:hypothetical protein
MACPPIPHRHKIEKFTDKGAELQETIQKQSALVDALKQKRTITPRKVQLGHLSPELRLRQLCPESKHFIDTVKLIAYRAESALAGEIREYLQREDDARALLRRLFVTPANLRPDYIKGTLTVELHRFASPLQDAAIAQLCSELNATETTFPTTSLQIIFRQVDST